MKLCREFKQLPSAVLAEDAYLIKLLNIEAMGSPEREEVDSDGE